MCSLQAVNAQYYDFSMRSNSYSNLSNSTVISDDEWDYETYFVNPSFKINAIGYELDSISLNETFFGFLFHDNEIGYFYPLTVGISSRGSGLSPISWQEEGTSPNKILKVEFKNAGLDEDNNNTDFLNFQVWFYENDGTIEVHYGPSSIDAQSYNPWSGQGPIVGYENNDVRGIFLEGDSSNPTVKLYSYGINDEVYLSGMPSSGTVYVFGPRRFQISTPTISDAVSFSAYPNPFNNSLTITCNKTADITLTDINGRVIDNFTVDGKYELNTAYLSQGVYFLRCSNGSVMKIIK